MRTETELLAAIVATQQEVATAGLEPDAVMRVITARTQTLTGADGAVVELAEGDEMVYQAVAGTAAASLGVRLKIATSLSGLCVRTGEVLRCDDSETDPRVDKDACRRVGVRSMVVVPLRYQGTVVGVLKVLSNRPGAFGDQEVNTLQLMAALLAAALHNAQAFERGRAATAERGEALRRSERRYRTLVTAAAQIVWVMAPDGTPVVVHGGEDYFGVTDAPVPAASWLERTHPDDRARVGSVASDAIARGQPFQMEYRLRRTDGTWRQVASRGLPVRDADGRVLEWVGVIDDVTDRRQLEDQFRQAQKMEAVGRLAGGVAHDFNNLLTVINGFSKIVLDTLPSGTPHRESVEMIRDAGQRAAVLTRQLLAFSRKQVLQPTSLNLDDLLAGMSRILAQLIGADVDLTVRGAPEPWVVQADAGQIEQVVMNLAVNARDAMPTGGQLTIETANVTLDAGYVSVHPEARPGQYVRLAVTDTGCGMDAATKARIFEPFFTTKGENGTGLGLATVFGIVKQSGGHIEVYSEVGVGTTFKAYLPRDRSAPSSSESGAALRPTPARGSETVLLAEDEDGLRRLAKMVLQRAGYTVLEARHGGEALHLCERHDGPIHLLATDVVMPSMGGRQAAERLRVLRPEMRVLFLSGYTDDTVVRHGVLEADVAFLQKPFSPDALVQKVREVLDAR
ncbi:GAF domain-containing protein [Gemmata sp. JC673]|uniref:histidine kinase n=1 Tax=Gemmata algarum TaxID=2975278 RepID=A0ABU5EU03_9BACT|nr:ATP-binding protein [Gemmata algarum]MDY3557942.1 GAF domain-containing protein [Gemmata algarum]